MSGLFTTYKVTFFRSIDEKLSATDFVFSFFQNRIL